MKKTVELKKDIKRVLNEVETEQQAENFETAEKLAKELTALIAQYEAAKVVEEEEKPQDALVSINQMNDKQVAKLRNRAFNNLVLGRELTEEERAAYYNDGTDATVTSTTTGQIGATPSKGGYLVPTEQMDGLREYRKAYTPLKEYCHVIQAQSRLGNMPTLGDEAGLLVSFDEMNKINESDFEFGQVSYQVKSYGDIIPVSNELIEDANVSILDIVGQRLMRKTVNTENAKILELLAGLTGTAASGYKDLMKALNVTLDPVYYADAKIFTNQDGFQAMSEWTDGQNRPLLVPDVAVADTYRFRGKPIIVLPNSQLKTVNKKAPLYVGNLADYCMFFDRKGVEIAVSTEYKFGLNATSLRCIVRFGVTKDDESAMTKLELTVA
ncbi:MAG: phage major capsid protein [Selenomonadaceae bacterium]|nr:phage major capsid protein [Selenomonadaceae bacterium]